MLFYPKIPLHTNYRFINSSKELGYLFKFSSDLEKIGIEWDVYIPNGVYIEVISEPIEINRPQYGTLSVRKVRADVATDYHTITKVFWLPDIYISEVENGLYN